MGKMSGGCASEVVGVSVGVGSDDDDDDNDVRSI